MNISNVELWLNKMKEVNAASNAQTQTVIALSSIAYSLAVIADKLEEKL